MAERHGNEYGVASHDVARGEFTATAHHHVIRLAVVAFQLDDVTVRAIEGIGAGRPRQEANTQRGDCSGAQELFIMVGVLFMVSRVGWAASANGS